MYKGMYAYPWDLVDEGAGTALGRMRDCGINTVTLAASYHAGKFLRPHAPARRVYFPEDGTVYVRPRLERYGAIKPIPSRLVAERDMFAELAADMPDMGRVAWTVCLHNTALGTRHPEFTVRNCYGDSYPYSLCPAYPEVRQFVVTLCADMAERYELNGLALETPGFLPFDHGFHHEFFLLPMNRWASWLLGLCFSEGTIAAAEARGIDAERLRWQACASLDGFFARPEPVPDRVAAEWWIADLVADPEWAVFLSWRCQLTADLVAEVRAALPKETTLAVIPTVQSPPAAAWSEGSDLGLLAGAADALEIPVYEPSAAAVALDARDARRRAGEDARINYILRPAWPDLANGVETAAAVRVLRESGLSGIAFYNYGHVALGALDRVREALAVLEEVP